MVRRISSYSENKGFIYINRTVIYMNKAFSCFGHRLDLYAVPVYAGYLCRLSVFGLTDMVQSVHIVILC